MDKIDIDEYEQDGLVIKAVKGDNTVGIFIRDIVTQEQLYNREIETFNKYPSQLQIENIMDDALFIYTNRKAFKRHDQMNEVK